MKNEDEWEEAPKLLGGVVEANQARESKKNAEELAKEAADHKANAKAKNEEEARLRASWPKERTTPLKSRIVMRAVSGSKAICSAGAGGKHGIREGWTVRVVFADRTVNVPVVAVSDTTTTFELPSKDIADVKEIELMPRVK
jgi:hypothetical protein